MSQPDIVEVLQEYGVGGDEWRVEAVYSGGESYLPFKERVVSKNYGPIAEMECVAVSEGGFKLYELLTQIPEMAARLAGF